MSRPDEEPDAPVHGECAAEIASLRARAEAAEKQHGLALAAFDRLKVELDGALARADEYRREVERRDELLRGDGVAEAMALATAHLARAEKAELELRLRDGTPLVADALVSGARWRATLARAEAAERRLDAAIAPDEVQARLKLTLEALAEAEVSRDEWRALHDKRRGQVLAAQMLEKVAQDRAEEAGRAFDCHEETGCSACVTCLNKALAASEAGAAALRVALEHFRHQSCERRPEDGCEDCDLTRAALSTTAGADLLARHEAELKRQMNALRIAFAALEHISGGGTPEWAERELNRAGAELEPKP